MFDDQTTVIRSSSPVETTVGNEVVLMSVDAGQCYALGDTASEVWRLLAQPTTVAALTAQLESVYQALPGAIAADLRELLAQMHTMGLVETR